MAEETIPSRSRIPSQYTWNAAAAYKSPADWEAEVQAVLKDLDDVGSYQGRLAEGPGLLAEALTARDEITRRVRKAGMYAYISYSVDTTNSEAAGMLSEAQSAEGKVMAALAFINPEILAIGQETLEKWMEQEPRLSIYRHNFADLFRTHAHVRPVDVEEVLGMVLDPFSSVEITANMLIDSDFTFRPAHSKDGQELQVNQAALEKVMSGPDRVARQTAWESYTDMFLAFKNTLANNLITSVKQNAFMARARRYSSTLEAALFANRIPVEVFYHVIDTFRRNLPTWHRYWKIRRKVLGVGTLHPYDIRAPLTTSSSTISYEQSVEQICAGLALMGQEYADTIRKGCLDERWVDVYPNRGKTAGAFSFGAPGTFPYIVMNYDDTIFSLSTLAHELGHSMHSYLTWQAQPEVYRYYPLFAAEVASNFHQAIVRDHLLNTSADPVFQINVIEEAMSNFHRYFFIMPTLARFELEIHQRVERGEGLTAQAMIEMMADLFEEGYGGETEVDRQRVGITWATFTHLYEDYYVYQYATGISAANALARQILEGKPGSVDDYLRFLKAGSSMYPLDALREAGVDLTTPEPVERTFQVLSDLVDRLDSMLSLAGK